MKLGDVAQSIQAWQKLVTLNLRPRLALIVLRYIKQVIAEHENAERLRVALVRELTGTPEGQDARIDVGTPAYIEYTQRLTEIMEEPSSLPLMEVNFEEIIDAADDKGGALSPRDLALLEHFFPDSKPLQDEQEA